MTGAGTGSQMTAWEGGYRFPVCTGKVWFPLLLLRATVSQNKQIKLGCFIFVFKDFTLCARHIFYLNSVN